MVQFKQKFMILKQLNRLQSASTQMRPDTYVKTWHLVRYYWVLIGQCIIERVTYYFFRMALQIDTRSVFLCYQTEQILQRCHDLILWHLINVYTVCQSTN